MKFLLAAVNAKYIHSNLGVYSLKKYADEKKKQQGTAFSGPDWEIEIGEYTINHQMDYMDAVHVGPLRLYSAGHL